MPDEIRWLAVLDRTLVPRLQLPEPTVIVFVAAVDVLAALERDDAVNALRSGIEALLARQQELSP